MHHPTDRITHTTVFDTPVVENWLERDIDKEEEEEEEEEEEKAYGDRP